MKMTMHVLALMFLCVLTGCNSTEDRQARQLKNALNKYCANVVEGREDTVRLLNSTERWKPFSEEMIKEMKDSYEIQVVLGDALNEPQYKEYGLYITHSACVYTNNYCVGIRFKYNEEFKYFDIIGAWSEPRDRVPWADGTDK